MSTRKKRKARGLVTAGGEGVALAEPATPKSEWPEGVTPPVDCVPVKNKRTKIDETVVYWDTGLHLWQVPHGWQGRSVEWVQNNYGSFYFAKSKYSNETPPPIPDGYERLHPSVSAVRGDKVYVAGGGWNDYNSRVGIFLLAAGPIWNAPEGYRRLGPNEITFPYRDVTHQEGQLLPVGVMVTADNLRGAWRTPLAVPPGFTEVNDASENLRPGAIVYNRTIGAWVPWVGPSGAPAIRTLVDYGPNVLTGVAHLNADQIPEGWEQLGMGAHLQEGDEVLTYSGKYTIAAAAPLIGRPAYLFINSLSLLRRKATTPDPQRVPVEQFMSAELLNMLINNPNAPQFRGLVRREHKLIIPVELAATGASADISAWLEKEYFTRFGLPSSHDGYCDVAAVRIRAARTTARVPTPIIPPETIDYVSVHVQLEERVSGHQTYSRTDSYEGDADVPVTVVLQGRDAVRRWVREQFIEGDLDLERHVGDNDYDGDEDTDHHVNTPTVSYEEPVVEPIF